MKRAGVVLSLVVVLFGGALAVLSCGGGGGGGQEPSVALFADTEYVQYDESDNEAEASNVMRTLQHLGIEATAFTGISASAFSAALSGRTVLAFPELDPFLLKLAPALSDSAIAVIHDFVQDGGTMILFSGERVDSSIADTVFGWNIPLGSEHPNDWQAYLDTTVAAGTSFAGGPSAIANQGQITNYQTSPLPAGSKVVYGTSTAQSSVTVMPYGSGQVIHLGWDWSWWAWTYPASPITTGQDGGWFEVLDRAVRY
ncbi:MAG: hypothetical protein JSV00_03295 [bacterium]|nr:MAG: hypothetical protein JSV00_03295 [bacterium]